MPPNQPHRATVADIRAGLQKILRCGVRPGLLRQCPELLSLECVRARVQGSTDPDLLAFGLEAVLLDALAALGDGPSARAARLLLGAVVDSRGRLLKDRRRLAAAELDVLPPTFRQNYEDDLLLDVAAEVFRIEMGLGD